MPPSARTSCATWTRANSNEGPAVKLLRLAFKNLFRHRLRTALTILGIATAVMAFGLIRTIVGAWNAGVTGAAANRMITRHRVSLIFPLPLPYRGQIAKVPGVTAVSWAHCFGWNKHSPQPTQHCFGPECGRHPGGFALCPPDA